MCTLLTVTINLKFRCNFLLVIFNMLNQKGSWKNLFKMLEKHWPNGGLE